MKYAWIAKHKTQWPVTLAPMHSYCVTEKILRNKDTDVCRIGHIS